MCIYVAEAVARSYYVMPMPTKNYETRFLGVTVPSYNTIKNKHTINAYEYKLFQ